MTNSDTNPIRHGVTLADLCGSCRHAAATSELEVTPRRMTPQGPLRTGDKTFDYLRRRDDRPSP